MLNQADTINSILKSPDGKVGNTNGVEGVLARLWRTILKDEKVAIPMFENLMMDFLNAGKRKFSNNSVSKMYTRGNLRRAFEKPTMTFKVFVQGMCFLKKKKLRIFAETTDYKGKVSIHVVSVDLDLGDIDEYLYAPEIPEPTRFESKAVDMANYAMREAFTAGIYTPAAPHVEGSDAYAEANLYIGEIQAKGKVAHEPPQRQAS